MSSEGPVLQLPSLSLSAIDLSREGKFERLLKLLEERKKPYKPHQRNRFLLYAAAYGNLEVVSVLIDKYRCDPHFVKEGLSPLHCAAIYGHLHLVKYFVTVQDIRSDTNPMPHGDALHSMCQAVNSSKHHFLKAGCNPNHNHVEIAKFLIEYGWKLSSFNQTRLHHTLSLELIADYTAEPTYSTQIFDFTETNFKPQADSTESNTNEASRTQNLMQTHDTKSQQNLMTTCVDVVKLMLSHGHVSDLVHFIVHGHITLAELKDLFTGNLSLIGYIHSTQIAKYLVACEIFSVTSNLITTYKKYNKHSEDGVHVEVLKWLVQYYTKQVYCTSTDSLLLEHACKSDTDILMKAMLENNLDLMHEWGTLLHEACQNEDLVLVSLLVKKGCNQSLVNRWGQLPIHVAISQSKMEIVELVSSCNINSQDNSGNTPLHVACQKVRTEIVRYLVDKGCDQNLVNHKGQLPLHIAVVNGNTEITKLVSSCDVNKQDLDGNTPLHLAYASTGRRHPNSSIFEIVEYLAYEKKCDLTLCNQNNQLALHILIGRSFDRTNNDFFLFDSTIMKITNSTSFDIINATTGNNSTLLHIACYYRHLDLVRCLILKDSNIEAVNDNGYLPLHFACQVGSIDFVKLLSHNISKDSFFYKTKEGATPLHLACKNKPSKEIVKYLVFEMDCKPVNNPEVFADLNIEPFCSDENDIGLLLALATERNVNGINDSCSPLLIACESNNIQAVRHFTLQLKCMCGNSRNEEILPLHVACTKSAEMVDLVANSSNVNVQFKGQTPLHIACHHGMTDVVNLLVNKYNCDQSVLNDKNELPLHLACAQSLDTVKLLAASPDTLQAVTREGYTPFHIACKHNELGIVKYFLNELKCDISSLVRSNKVHPLHLACTTKNVEIVRSLVKHMDRKFEEKSVNGNTPLHIACSSGSVEVVEYLITEGDHDTLVLNDKNEYPLHIACTKSLPLVKITSSKCTAKELEAKTIDNLTPLHIAASCGLLDVVKYLVEKKNCNVFALDYYDNNALVYACGKYSDSQVFPNVARYLVNRGCKPTEKVYKIGNAIQRSINIEHFELLKALVDDEVNLNSLDDDGNTPLMLLCKHISSLTPERFIEAKEFLLKSIDFLVSARECQQHISNKKGMIALHLACANKHDITDLLDLLNCSTFDFDDSTTEDETFTTAKDKNGNTPLHIACEKSNLSTLRHMLSLCDSTECTINIQNEEGQSLLHIAVVNDYIEVVKYLLDEVEEVCSILKDKQGMAPVHYAQSKEVLELLLRHDSTSKDLPDADGNTALHLAAADSTGDWAQVVIPCLLSYGSPVNVINKNGDTPLHLACDSKHHRNFECFLSFLKPELTNSEEGSDIEDDVPMDSEHPEFFEAMNDAMSTQNKDGNTPLHIACLANCVDTVKALCTSHFKHDLAIQNSSGDTPFHIACATGSFPIVDYIVETQTECVTALAIKNNHGNLPFHVALDLFQSSQLGKVKASQDTLEFFARNCNDINIQNLAGDTLLHLACTVKNPFSLELVKFFAERSNSSLETVNTKQQLPLHIAASESSLPKVKLCCTPELVNQQDIDGNTPLHIACSKGHLHIAKFLLLEVNCIPNVRNKNKQTALHLACSYLNPGGYSNQFLKLVKRTSEMEEDLCLQDQNGDTPLHLLCKASGKKHAYMEALLKSNPGNVSQQNELGETPLTIICSSSDCDLKLVQCLLDCDTSCQLKEFPHDTVLHMACRKHAVEVVKCLVEHNKVSEAALIPNGLGELPIHLTCERVSESSLQCIEILRDCYKDLSHKTKNGDTILHLACGAELKPDLLAYLVKEAKDNRLEKNNLGDLPLHIACRSKQLSKRILKLLANRDNINCQNEGGNTAVHEMSIHHVDHTAEKISFLIKKGAKFDVPNKEGRYAVHFACQFQSLNIVEQFGHCGLASKTIDGNTVLHEACRNATCNAQEIVQYLLDKPPLDKTSANSDGDLALHIACRNPNLDSDIIKCMAEMKITNVSLPNKIGNTPLHDMINANRSSDLILHLLKNANVHDIGSCNQKQESLLHLACRNNLTEVVYFLLEPERACEFKEVINQKDANGTTPIMLTSDLDVVQILLDHGAKADSLYKMHEKFFNAYKSDSPPETPVRFLVIGNAKAGKTTLISSLQNIKEAPNLARTAGIVSTDFHSEVFGQVSVYDFAGQPEYYASHDSFIHTTIKNSPPVVLLVVDLTHGVERIMDNIRYWSGFIGNRLISLTDKAHLYVICSHADQIRGKIELSKVRKEVKKEVDSYSILKFMKLMSMNCTDPRSKEISLFCKHLAGSTKKLRYKGVLNFRSHCLSTFLRQTFKHEVAIPVEKLLYKLNFYERNHLVPTDYDSLRKLCQDLNECGIIIFLENDERENFHLSWIVLNKDALLAHVSGRLFAPASFPEYVGPYGSHTGVVSFSKLRSLFPQYDPSMLFGFLSCMEFCNEIKDEEVKKMMLENDFSASDKHYFFPNAVEVERPSKEWCFQFKKIKGSSYRFGWIMECVNGHFSPHFVQLLLLRLMFGSTSIRRSSRAPLDIRTMSTVWKSGIVWANSKGTVTLVDVVDQSKVLVLMACSDDLKDKLGCLKHRSTLLNKIRGIKCEICAKVQTKEFFIDPEYIHHPLKSTYEEHLISVEEFVESVSRNNPYILSRCGNRVALKSVLYFDPYIILCNKLANALCNTQKKFKPNRAFIDGLANHFHEYFELFAELSQISPTVLAELNKPQLNSIEKFIGLLQRWMKLINGSLKAKFDEITVFRNMKILGSECAYGCPDHQDV